MLSNLIHSDGKTLIDEKKPIAVVCIADANNLQYAIPMILSLRHFHDWPVYLYTNGTLAKDIPNVIVKDLTPYLQDKMFFYRATPILCEPLLNEYACVLKIDADSLILGDLSPILETKDYDVGTVINWNRFDEKFYPAVQGWGIFPNEYFNCGFVALRSKKFTHDWLSWCYSPQFDRLQYKEQDGLNGLIYFGNWNVRCFDQFTQKDKNPSWYGIIGKGEWNRAIYKDNKVIVPKGLGDTPFPPADIHIRVAHMGGGAGTKKDNWAVFFSPEVMEYIRSLLRI